MSKRKTTEQFIEEAKKVHGDRYDYSLVDYKTAHIKIKIICKEHGIFEQTPSSHLSESGCLFCNNSGKKRLTNEKFIKKANIKHNNKYDYSLVDYDHSHIEIKIICKEHGEFEQTPKHHLSGHGCRYCAGMAKLTTNIFIEISKNIHDDKYDYSLVNYKGSNIKVKIICKEHGEFKQTPYKHKKGSGCSICKESKGEKKIRNILKEKNIDFETQKTFEGCKNKSLLRFDFYLSEINTCIEYDGIQHYEINEFFGGEKEFKYREKLDIIKTNYCDENDIKLIRIKYNEDINDILNKIYN